MAQRQRCHSRFCLDAFVVIEVNIPVDQFVCFLERLWLVAVDALCFQNIMEVTIKIKNEENETGKLQIADWALIGKNDDFIAYLDQQLLMDTDERVDSILSSISTASGKEIEIKLPYPLIYMDKEKEIDRNMPYKIAVTKYPSRKYIQFG